jgi:hypothetical protein
MANYQSVTPVQLGQAAMTTSFTTVYSTPAATRTYVKQLDICNTTSSPIDVYVSLVPFGGTAGIGNALFYKLAVDGYSTLSWTGTQIMNPQGTLQVMASASGCTITASGGEAI